MTHRSDSMWATDCIANPFFLNKKVSRTTIKNLRWQLGGEIIQVTFRKSSTSLVQELKKQLVHKNFATGYWLPLSLFKFYLKFLDQPCWRFSKCYPNNFSTELSSQIFDCCPRNFLIQEERIGNVVSTSHWITPVWQSPQVLKLLFLKKLGKIITWLFPFGVEVSVGETMIRHWS